MITSGEVDFDRAGEYNGIVISYGDKTVNIWRIEIKDKNDNSPERISVRNDNLLWKTGSEGEIIPEWGCLRSHTFYTIYSLFRIVYG